MGQKKPNAWGLFDLYGSVWQWCQDIPAPYGGDGVDPSGAMSGETRSFRGAWPFRSSFRGLALPGRSQVHYGFRVCMN